MKVILLDYVYKHGVAGEVIDVADGYARNYLIPRGLAVKATAGEMRRARVLREQATTKRAALEKRINELAELIDDVELVFGRRASSTGTLFGSVTTHEIAIALLEKTGADINRRRISQQSLRETGTHRVPVRLGNDLSPELRITIMNENAYAEHLEARANESAVAEEARDSAEAEAEAEVAAAVALLDKENQVGSNAADEANDGAERAVRSESASVAPPVG